MASLVAQMVKNLPVMQETWVWSLSQKDTLEKGMATHSSIIAWRIPWTVHGVTEGWTFIYLLGCVRSLLQHVGSLVATWKLSYALCDLILWWGIKPRPPALGARSLSHWTTREVPYNVFLEWRDGSEELVQTSRKKASLARNPKSFLIFFFFWYLPLGQNCSSLTTGFKKTDNNMWQIDTVLGTSSVSPRPQKHPIDSSHDGWDCLKRRGWPELARWGWCQGTRANGKFRDVRTEAVNVIPIPVSHALKISKGPVQASF